MIKIYYILLFFLGATLCSFISVVGSRIPAGKNILFPNSYCDNCHMPLTWLDKLPIIGFIVNLGTCHYCNKKINYSYIVNESLFGIVFCLIILTKSDYIPRISILLLILLFSITDQLYGIIMPIFFLPELIFIYSIGINFHYRNFLFMFALLSIFSFATKGLGFGDVEIFSFLALILSLKKVLLIIILTSILCLIIEIYKQNFDSKIKLIPYVYWAVVILFLFK